MNKRFSIILSICLLFSVHFQAQLTKANTLFEKNHFIKAIKKYKKVAKNNSPDKGLAFSQLGNCYLATNDYLKAEDAYRKALESNTQIPASTYYNYGSVLKVNGKYEEALKQFETFIKSNPNDTKTKNAVKSCREIKMYLSKPIEYDIKNVSNINTQRSEFSPVYMNGQLVYVAEKQHDATEYEVTESNGQPFMNVYISKVNGSEGGKSKLFNKKINSYAHEGPLSVSADGQILFFTRTDNNVKRNFVNTAKIYSAQGSNRSWRDIKSFDYNSDFYSVAHPTLNKDNSILFFASDMPGGFGGKDIWMCTKNGAAWNKPVNLGADVNTSGDELFPYFRKDGQLYFSSNGLPGFGGLDIYSAKQVNGQWILNRNEGLNINSSFDDFAPYFINDSTGYFSSNRTGGKGKDDIYYFKYTNKNISVKGIIYLTESTDLPAKNLKVTLIDKDGNHLDSMKTDNKGFFEFKNLDADKSYMAIVDENDPQFKGKARYFLASDNNVLCRVSNKNGKDKFVFKNLPIDKNALPDLFVDDDLTLAGNLLYGENPSKPLKNTRLKLVNAAGDVIEETTTNEFGAFAFRNLPTDQSYMVTVEDSDITLPPNTKITLTNKSGKTLKTFYTGTNKFKFELLKTEKDVMSELNVNDEDLIMELYGYAYDQNKKPIANGQLLINEELNPKNNQVIKTGDNGKFHFKNLKADKNYMFSVEDDDPVFKGVNRIYLADSKGRIYKTISRDGKGRFEFKLLETDKSAMGEFVVDDPWLAVLEMKNKKEKEQLTIVESIYYAFGDFKFDADGQKVLDKVIAVLQTNPKLLIELSSHTDSRSSDDFNKKLSQKRAQFAVDYIVSKGIDKKRMQAIGYGESKLLNKCTNTVECTEEEHKLNRRTEFKITEAGAI
jgi:outer membrane protein OmpA-like peptidoglycan-associated protein/tetratricopeptide (TPR) repeat protein